MEPAGGRRKAVGRSSIVSPPDFRLPLPVLHDIADGSLLVEYPGLAEDEANARAVWAARRIESRAPEGFLSAVVGAQTLFVEFDPARISAERFRTLLASRGSASPVAPRRTLRIPVAYGDEAGMDLPHVARAAALSPEEYVRRHAEAAYRVSFLGFAPGFAYMTGLPAELETPRLSTPRPRVAAGTVAVAGRYTGIYPGETPGGWRLIGHTHVRLFDRDADPPTLLVPGDEVRFERVQEEKLLSTLPPIGASSSREAADRPLFRVLSPGVFSSLQGAPRYGGSRYGVPPGGAMDLPALERGNAILGNPPAAAAVEMTLIGARLEALAETMICLIGASGEEEGKGGMIPAEEPVRILSGQRLRVAQIRGAARAYLCVKGGFAQPAGFQISPRLVAGDLLAAASHVTASSRPFARTRRSEAAEESVVRVVLDPRGGPFSTAGIATLFSTSFRVSASSDRRGIRLEGAPIELSEAPDVPPEGTPPGGIQVARDGMPIVLGPDRPVTGGYARIGTIIQADFPLIAERPPGSVVHFRGVSLAEALAARVG